MLASTITALVAAGGASMIFAVCQANDSTGDVRAVKSSGNYVLSRVASSIRCARAIGEVTNTSITLWVDDLNGDDRMTMNETATIYYDSANKRILYSRPAETSANASSMTVAASDITSAAAYNSKLSSVDAVRNSVWATDVEACRFIGYPSNTDTRLVETRIALATEDGQQAFRISASPRASADYLFVSGANGSPMTGSTRYQRTKVSSYSGVSTTP